MRTWIAAILAALAIGLAVAPWLGRYSHTADALASLLPMAPVFALIALIIGYRGAGVLTVATAAIALIVSGGLIFSEYRAAREPPPAPGTPQFSIVTHNLARTNRDPQLTIRALLAADADILLLQEADGRMKPYLEQLAGRYPFHSECPSLCGLALYSRLPIGKVQWKFRGSNGQAMGPEVIWAQLDFPGRPSATIATLHLPWPYPSREQYVLRKFLVATIARVDSRYLVLAGDFNLTPWGDAMATLDSGLAPMRRVTRGLFSFPAHILGTRKRARLFADVPVFPILPIDHMFVGPGWSVVSVERLPATGSDHYPVRIRLALRALPG